jgi:hypothetical protein
VFGKGRQAEIRDPHFSLTIEHDIGWFEIPVNHPLFMCSRQASAQFPRDFQRLLVRKLANSPKKRRQILAVDVFHRQVS